MMLRCSYILFMLLLTVSSLANATPCPPGVHPIVDAVHSYLFGGSVNGRWVDGDKLAAKVTRGEQYRLYSPTTYLGTAKGTKAVLPGENDYPESCPTVELVMPKAAGACPDTVLGIAGAWNALPRMPRAQSTSQPAYQQVVRQWLDQNGLKHSSVRISKIMRFDLEGDGVDEVIICAGTAGDNEKIEFNAPSGYYSCVLLRKVIKGVVKTIPLEEQHVLNNKEWETPIISRWHQYWMSTAITSWKSSPAAAIMKAIA